MLRIIWTFILSLQESTESPHRTDERSECQQTVKQDYTEPSVWTQPVEKSHLTQTADPTWARVYT